MEAFDPLAQLPNNSNNQRGPKPNPEEFSRAPVVTNMPDPDAKHKGFLRTAIEDAAKETLKNYIIPTALEGAYGITEGFLRRLFRQDSTPKAISSSKKGNSNGPYISYRGFYSGNTQASTDLEKAARESLGRVDIRIMEYKSREEAEDVLSTISEFFSIYDYVSIDRIYEWSGKQEYMPDNAKNWGFYDISGITRKTDMYSGKSYLYFPKVVALK